MCKVTAMCSLRMPRSKKICQFEEQILIKGSEWHATAGCEVCYFSSVWAGETRTLLGQPACIDIAQQRTPENVLTNCIRSHFQKIFTDVLKPVTVHVQQVRQIMNDTSGVVASTLVNLGERLFPIAVLTSCHQGSTSSQKRRSLGLADCSLDSWV